MEMNIAFSMPDIKEEEIKEVVDTLRSGWITTGPKTKEFEKNIAAYCGVKKAACLNSATACMELTLRLLGVGPGDQVITSAYTYTASASVVCHVGADLVLIDTGENSYEMDYEKLEEAITEKTKVIIGVDLAGVICDYSRIFEIVKRKSHLFHAENKIQSVFSRIIVMADAAHAFGAYVENEDGRKTRCGNIADFTCFSFHAVKNLTTAEGGAVTWKSRSGLDDEELYQQYMMLSLHGQSKDAFHKMRPGSWEYDITGPFYKCNMTDIMAAIGLRQLERYGRLLQRRKEIATFYNHAIDEWNKASDGKISYLSHDGERFQSSRHLYLVQVIGAGEKQRNGIINGMAKKGISCNVHYKPLPMFTAYIKLGFHIESYPNAYAAYSNEITLPLHTGLTEKEMGYILASFFQEVERIGL